VKPGSKRCQRCEKWCDGSRPFRKIQNTRAMYQSERVPTYWHEDCFALSDAENKADRDAYVAEMAEGFRRAMEELKLRGGK
jgi:hypothetical protein